MNITRRQFGITSVLAASAVAGKTSPNEKLNVAFIGAGGRGASNLKEFTGENIVAFCDVDDRRAAATYKKHPKVPRFRDYRRMLDKLDRQIDGVVISAPNHIHAPASELAMRMGKHVYCEKPLSHSIAEARSMARLAKETGLATQMGTQIHASENFRRIVELIQSGAIGDVKSVHLRLPSGRGRNDRPSDQPPVPDELDWNLFVGPAPMCPYHPIYVPHGWHYWWDFGGGSLGNMGCHYLDLVFWALKLRAPKTIEAHGTKPHAESTPADLSVKWTFDREQGDPLEVTWDHGREQTPIWSQHKFPKWAWGVFVGSKGMLLVNYPQHALWPEDNLDLASVKPDPWIPKSIGHHREWIQACKHGGKTSCNFDYADALTECVHLGNIAFRTGKKLHWKPDTMSIPNVPQAETLLQREYRKGW